MKTLGEGGHEEICLISGKASQYSYMILPPPPLKRHSILHSPPFILCRRLHPPLPPGNK